MIRNTAYAFILLLHGAVIVAAANGQAQGAAPRIVFLGDSLSAGYGVGEHLAFPALVEQRLHAAGLSAEVVNAGVSGDTTAGGVRRIDWILKQPLDVLVIELGGNDALRGLPPGEAKRNLEIIIDKTRNHYPDALIVLAAMRAPPSMGAAYESAFNSIFTDVSNKKDLPLLPFLLEGIAGSARLNLPDGLHPNQEGHEKIAARVTATLLSLLTQRQKSGK